MVTDLQEVVEVRLHFNHHVVPPFCHCTGYLSNQKVVHVVEDVIHQVQCPLTTDQGVVTSTTGYTDTFL